MPNHPSASEFPVALTIAGSDSGGGAGIQADLKTFHAFGVFGASAITALTAQNTIGVRSVHAVPLQMVRDQVDAVAEDLGPKAVKTGMLATAELVAVVADLISRHGLDNYVLDPVMVASSGDRLLDEDAEGTVAARLVPMATLVTPNLDEARILTALPVVGESGQREAAHVLVEMGAGAALVKGGHGEGSELLDLLWDGKTERIWRRRRIMTRNTHGTGCTLSAGVAAGLAMGRPLEDAVDRALDYVARAIASAPGLGGRNVGGTRLDAGDEVRTAGHGPVNHMIPVG